MTTKRYVVKRTDADYPYLVSLGPVDEHPGMPGITLDIHGLRWCSRLRQAGHWTAIAAARAVEGMIAGPQGYYYERALVRAVPVRPKASRGEKRFVIKIHNDWGAPYLCHGPCQADAVVDWDGWLHVDEYDYGWTESIQRALHFTSEEAAHQCAVMLQDGGDTQGNAYRAMALCSVPVRRKAKGRDPEVILEPPRVLRVFVGPKQVDMIEHDRLVLTNDQGRIVVSLESGQQDIHVHTADPSLLSFFEMRVAPVWGLEPLVLGAVRG